MGVMDINMKHWMYVLLAVLLLVTAGCGKKVWPEPDAQEEKFALQIENSEIDNSCLEIQAVISGNYRNLAGLVLELEEADEPCPGCPLRVDQTVNFGMNSPHVERQDERIQISYCGVDPKKYIRFRLVGSNVYSQISEAQSEVKQLY